MARRILFVDGDESVAAAVTAILEEMGCDVRLETSGMRGFDAFYKDPGQFDLVITDQGMPDMSGLLLTQRIVRIRPDMPVILLTGLSGEFHERARQSGIRGFVSKPVNPTELTQTVEATFTEQEEKTRSAGA